MRFVPPICSVLFVAMVLAGPSLAQSAAENPQARLPSVTVAAARMSEVVGQIPVAGTLVPRKEVLVYPQVTGFEVESIHVEVGDTVTAGEVLIKLNSTTLAAQLAQAEATYQSAEAAVRQAQSQIESAQASLTQAEAALERSQSLRISGNISQAGLDQSIAVAKNARASFASANDGLEAAKAQVLQAAAQRDIAAINLDHAEIRAQVSGLVSERRAQIGAISASGGEPLLKLIANGEIEVAAEVIETALVQIEVGDLVELSIAGPGQVEGTVRLIEPTVDPVNRLGLIRITTAASDALRSGMFASGNVITDRRIGLTVPATSVLTDGGETYVMAVAEGTVSKRDVVAGLLWQNTREIVSGLSEGEAVIVKAGAFFRDGDRVEPIAEGALK